MVKWVAAGLAGANFLGAVLAVRATLAHRNEGTATLLFVAGMIGACVAAFLFEHSVRAMEGPHVEASRYWAQVDFGGARDSQREAELEARFSRENRRFLIPAALGLASLALFIIGSVLLFVR